MNPSSKPQSARILLVDDDPQALESTRKILEFSEYDVTSATDGQMALEQVRKARFDLVITDVRMPRMGGLEFLKALSATDLPKRPKVVFCTTENGIGHIKAAIEAGADEYVMKPFDRDTIASKLQIVGLA